MSKNVLSRLLGSSVVFFSLFLIASSVSAATYYVSTNGNDANSCATAATALSDQTKAKRNITGASGGISCLFPGDTLDIRGGTYNENFNVTDGVTTFNTGTAGQRITMQGHAGETVALGWMFWGWETHIDYWTFDNLIVNGTQTGPNSGGNAFEFITTGAREIIIMGFLSNQAASVRPTLK